MVKGCPNCGPQGSIFSESFRVDDRWFIEFSCLSCMRLWTPRTMREIIVNQPSIARAKYVEKRLKMMIEREMSGIPAGALTK